MQNGIVIDLTLSDNDDQPTAPPPAKRLKTSAATPSSPFGHRSTSTASPQRDTYEIRTKEAQAALLAQLTRPPEPRAISSTQQAPTNGAIAIPRAPPRAPQVRTLVPATISPVSAAPRDPEPYLPVVPRVHLPDAVATSAGDGKQVHRGFSPSEIAHLRNYVRQGIFGKDFDSASARLSLKDIGHLLRKGYKANSNRYESSIRRIAKQCRKDNVLASRSARDIRAFLDDIRLNYVSHHDYLPSQALREKEGPSDTSDRVTALLNQRMFFGLRGGQPGPVCNFPNEFSRLVSDNLQLIGAWSGGAGDIETLTWVSDDIFIGGTTTHSDAQNQMYNKAGNLFLGSVKTCKVHTYTDHRIPRPIFHNGPNASDEMRKSQDPWLQTSVTCSAYDPVRKRAYTSSFDCKVKVWSLSSLSASDVEMAAVGEWIHTGKVNFVVVNARGVVATAADVPSRAIRVYHVGEDVSSSKYESLICRRLDGQTLDARQDAEVGYSEDSQLSQALRAEAAHAGVRQNTPPSAAANWAYFPATVQWGKCPGCEDLLLAGYSPRSIRGMDSDIPDDKTHTGELCLWDMSILDSSKTTGDARESAEVGRRVRTSLVTANIFEVEWHPTQPIFVVATSPFTTDTTKVHRSVKTQVRVFRKAKETNVMNEGEYYYAVVQILDCSAIDINLLVVKPNSPMGVFVAAGCTNGKVYVWDTGLGSKPVRVLKHGEPFEPYEGDREIEDTGIKFIEWGSSPYHLFTGGSDGKLIAWNIGREKSFDRVLCEVKGAISFGCFSPDHLRLLVGDDTGTISLLAIDKESINFVPDPIRLQLPPGHRGYRRVKNMTPRFPLTETLGDEARRCARELMEGSQIMDSGIRNIGAVQGPMYHETPWFDASMHLNNDRFKPLRADVQKRQQESLSFPGTVFRTTRPIRAQVELAELHRRNQAMSELPLLPETRAALERDRAEYLVEGDYTSYDPYRYVEEDGWPDGAEEEEESDEEEDDEEMEI